MYNRNNDDSFCDDDGDSGEIDEEDSDDGSDEDEKAMEMMKVMKAGHVHKTKISCDNDFRYIYPLPSTLHIV
ncbi:DNA-directed RNA polymerase subunit beta [Dirofilaria immitis]